MSQPNLAALQPGAVFHGRYRIVQCIKAGSMGAVYEVVDAKTDSHRALKVMLPGIIEDADLRARFELEARVTGNIESDHIVRTSDAGIDPDSGTPFLVMDLLRGDELGRLIEKRKTVPRSEVMVYLFQAALALDKTHAAGIVHRDLKPENLFVTYRDDGSPCLKILDFGIAKVVAQSNQAKATRAVGTPLYMSPEQIRGEGAIEPRADIYALGHIAYAMLAGEAYWTEESRAAGALFPLLSNILTGVKEPPSIRALRRKGSQVPPGFDEWFLKATAARAADRFERATLAIRALGEALGTPVPRSSLSSLDFEDAPQAARVAPIAASGPAQASGSAPISGRFADQATVPLPSAHASYGSGSDRVSMAQTTPATASHPGSRSSARSTVPIALGVIGIVALATLGFFALRSRNPSPEAKGDASAQTAIPSVVVAAADSPSAPVVEPSIVATAEPTPSAIASADTPAASAPTAATSPPTTAVTATPTATATATATAQPPRVKAPPMVPPTKKIREKL